MLRLRRALATVLSLALVCASMPAAAVERGVPSTGVKIAAPLTLPTTLPLLPTPQISAVPIVALQPVGVAQAPGANATSAITQLQAAVPAEQRSSEQTAALTFDGAGLKKKRDLGTLVAAGAGTGLLPVALKLPSLGVASYAAANALSFVFPLPQVYKTYAEGHARKFPIVRASLGAFGTILLGLVNASVLDKPFWGAMHVFIGLGMLAPYFVGKYLEKKGAAPRKWAAPEGFAEKGKLKRVIERLRTDGALKRTLLLGLPMLAASIGLYAAAAAVIPAALGAAMSPAALDSLLLGLQVFKALLFIAVFAPDVVALIKGRPPKGFTMGFNMVFFASVLSFTAWGFTAAAAEAAGPIRDQYLVLALRNLGESVASALSIVALWRANRAARKLKP